MTVSLMEERGVEMGICWQVTDGSPASVVALAARQ